MHFAEKKWWQSVKVDDGDISECDAVVMATIMVRFQKMRIHAQILQK